MDNLEDFIPADQLTPADLQRIEQQRQANVQAYIQRGVEELEKKKQFGTGPTYSQPPAQTRKPGEVHVDDIRPGNTEAARAEIVRLIEKHEGS